MTKTNHSGSAYWCAGPFNHTFPRTTCIYVHNCPDINHSEPDGPLTGPQQSGSMRNSLILGVAGRAWGRCRGRGGGLGGICLAKTWQEKIAHIYQPTHQQLVHAGLAFLEVDPLDGDALLPWDAEGSLHHCRGPTS